MFAQLARTLDGFAEVQAAVDRGVRVVVSDEHGASIPVDVVVHLPNVFRYGQAIVRAEVHRMLYPVFVGQHQQSVRTRGDHVPSGASHQIPPEQSLQQFPNSIVQLGPMRSCVLVEIPAEKMSIKH